MPASEVPLVRWMQVADHDYFREIAVFASGEWRAQRGTWHSHGPDTGVTPRQQLAQVQLLVAMLEPGIRVPESGARCELVWQRYHQTQRCAWLPGDPPERVQALIELLEDIAS